MKQIFSLFLAVVGPYYAWASTRKLPIIASGESEGVKFVVEEVLSGLDVPWGFDFVSQDQVLIAQKNGLITLLEMKTLKIDTVGKVTGVVDKGQGGLLDLQKHPAYPKEPWIYFTMSQKRSGGAATALGRFQFKAGKVSSTKILLSTLSESNTSKHFGSRIAFDTKGHVFFSVGERGRRKNAQELNHHAGKILRLNLDGSIPEDNPFVGLKGRRAEIWSYGHRNPQGLVFDKATNRLWALEHGPRGGDELNWIKPGLNYGWPEASYGREYVLPMRVGVEKKKGTEQPVHYFDPSIAPCGLELYTGEAFPKWKGNFFAGALKLTHLNRMVVDGTKFVKEERFLDKLGRRVRNVKQTPKGYLLLSTDRGEILRLRPKREQRS